MIYHVARAGEMLGEFSAEDFGQKRASGGFLPNDHYWTDGMTEWAEVNTWSPPLAATVKMTIAPPSAMTAAEFPIAKQTVGPKDRVCPKCGHVGPPKSFLGLTLPGHRCPKCGAAGMMASASP